LRVVALSDSFIPFPLAGMHLAQTVPNQLLEKKMLQEFKDFAMKGNVVDLAIGVIIGAAFGKIVDSLVNDIIMPIIGAITGGLDFSNYFIGLSKAVNSPALADAKKQGAVLAYGSFLTVVVNFVIIAFVLFLAVRAINKMKRGEAAEAPATPPPPPRAEVLLEQIRDELAKR
jgi:large conductance mechanosensitive channel